jgi:hypothetical protein
VASVEELLEEARQLNLASAEGRFRLGDLIEALGREFPAVADLHDRLAIDLVLDWDTLTEAWFVASAFPPATRRLSLPWASYVILRFHPERHELADRAAREGWDQTRLLRELSARFAAHVVVHGDLPAGVVDQARAGTFDPHHLREIMRAVNGIVEEEVLHGRPWSPAWSQDRELAQHAANHRAFKHAAAAIAATKDAQQALLDGGLHRVLGPAAHRLLIQAVCQALEQTGPDAALLAKLQAAGESAGIALTGPNGLRV